MTALEIEQKIEIGQEIVIDSLSDENLFAVVFEDDGETGYFYALDTQREDNQILDALYIYNVAEIADKQISSVIKIIWSEDKLKSALLINNYPHAVFDFELKRGYCRTGFPPSDKTWTNFNHDWSDKALVFFK